jgi:hypothetical protein
MLTKKTVTLLVVAIMASSGAAFADNANWTDEKAAQVDTNRNTDSGLGNGGEKQKNNGNWKDIGKETNKNDVDPGNSGNQCQGGKNEKSGGC